MKHARVVLSMAVVLLAGSLAAAGSRIEETREADPDVQVEVENISGSVVVTGWDRNLVEIRGTLGEGTKDLEVKGEGRRIRIRVVFPEGKNRNIEGTDLEIRMPRGGELQVVTVSAPIEVEDLKGDLELNTVSGEVTVIASAENISVNNVSGAIILEDDTVIDHGSFNNVSGRIVSRADYAPRARVSFNTVSGKITFNVPGDLNADFEVSTFSGGIDNDIGPRPTKSRWVPSQELSFSTGSGGARITLNTLSGRIEINRY